MRPWWYNYALVRPLRDYKRTKFQVSLHAEKTIHNLVWSWINYDINVYKFIFNCGFSTKGKIAHLYSRKYVGNDHNIIRFQTCKNDIIFHIIDQKKGTAVNILAWKVTRNYAPSRPLLPNLSCRNSQSQHWAVVLRHKQIESDFKQISLFAIFSQNKVIINYFTILLFLWKYPFLYPKIYNFL